MLPCGTPISCSCSSERVEPTLTLKERSDRKLNKPGEVAPETEIPEVRQNAVLPCCVVSFFKVRVSELSAFSADKT